MPLRGSPECLKCGSHESSLWTNAESLGIICLDCVNEAKDEAKSDDEGDNTKDDTKSRKRTRMTRSYKTRLNPFALPKIGAPKGRGRRALFKKVPMKAPTSVATIVTSEYVFYKVQLYLQ